MKRYQFAIVITTVVMLGYSMLFQAGAPLLLLSIVFAASPFLVIWMACEILKNAPYNGRSLKAGEDFGYQDIETDRLGVF